jgi:hypothetical protein
MLRLFLYAIVVLGVCSFSHLSATSSASRISGEMRVDKYEGIAELVSETHERSLAARERERRQTLSKKPWPGGTWGDTVWALCALFQNEKTDEANALLQTNANAYLENFKTVEGTVLTPEKLAKHSPWTYFGLSDYVRILCLFRADSTHYPGRLSPQTEAAMKEALWYWAKNGSRVKDADLDNLMVLMGTENHDLNLRPNYYLVASVLKDDSAYRDRLLDDGQTFEAHYAAYNQFFQKWATWRARYGLWVEIGSDKYQKYSYPALFNLAELSPDPVVRNQFRMMLDIAFIEEEQISAWGRRGGGRSRADFGKNSFEAYKELLYAQEGLPAHSSHTAVVETSLYQLPATAILLRFREFPANRSFVVANRVLGEVETGGKGNRLATDSALVNYAWRSPYLILGSTWQNPALSMPNSAIGKPTLKYGGISRQRRWLGVLFDDEDRSAIYTVFEKNKSGGREQHPFWSVQYKNMLVVQRITPDKSGMGSYNTGWVGVCFDGPKIDKLERDGWIFAVKGNGYTGVRFLDTGFKWDETGKVAIPKDHHRTTSTARILMIAGDREANGSFEKFQAAVLASQLVVEPNKVEFTGGIDGAKIVVHRYEVEKADRFKLPTINGNPIDIRQQESYKSPYLNARLGSGRLEVVVGPIKTLYDFDANRIDNRSTLSQQSSAK